MVIYKQLICFSWMSTNMCMCLDRVVDIVLLQSLNEPASIASKMVFINIGSGSIVYLRSNDSLENIYIGSDEAGIFKGKEHRIISYSVFDLGANSVFSNTTAGGLSIIFYSTVIDESNIQSFSSYNGFNYMRTPDLSPTCLSVWFKYNGTFTSAYFYY